MVYGRILYNNIKEYTPKWFPTIPYSQAVKPTFKRSPQVVSGFNANPNVKAGWRLFSKVFQQNSWMWQVFIFSSAFVMYYAIYIPFTTVYQYNNKNRTYEAAMIKERAHKKKLRQIQEAAEGSGQA